MTIETTNNIAILQVPENTFEDMELTEYPHWVMEAFKEKRLTVESDMLFLNDEEFTTKFNAGDYLLKPENGKVYGMNKYIFESLYKKFLKKR